MSEEKNVLSFDEINEMVENNLRTYMSIIVKRGYFYHSPPRDEDFTKVSVLTAYVNCVASKRVVQLTDEMVKWNKRLTDATIALGVTALCISVASLIIAIFK
jgi:hypothetical protein